MTDNEGQNQVNWQAMKGKIRSTDRQWRAKSGQLTGNEGLKWVNRQAMKGRNGSTDRQWSAEMGHLTGIYIYIRPYRSPVVDSNALVDRTSSPACSSRARWSSGTHPLPWPTAHSVFSPGQAAQTATGTPAHLLECIHIYVCVCMSVCVHACVCMCVGVGGISFLNILYCTFSDINLTQGKASKQASIM